MNDTTLAVLPPPPTVTTVAKALRAHQEEPDPFEGYTGSCLCGHDLGAFPQDELARHQAEAVVAALGGTKDEAHRTTGFDGRDYACSCGHNGTAGHAPVDTAAVQAQALRDAAEEWGHTTWNDVWLAAGVDDDVSAAQATVAWLRDRADRIERDGGAR